MRVLSMRRAKFPPMLQQSYSAGKSCVARRAAQGCTSVSRELLGSLIAGMHPAMLAAHTHSGPGTGMQGLEWLRASQGIITIPGLQTELPWGSLSHCLTAEQPESCSETESSSVPVILGAAMWTRFQPGKWMDYQYSLDSLAIWMYCYHQAHFSA